MKNKKRIIIIIVLAVVLAGIAAPVLAKGLDRKEPLPELSGKYFVGFDYAKYDVYGMAPVIFCKVRYDRQIEAVFPAADGNGEDPLLFALTDKQYSAITNGIELSVLYDLDPELSDPDEVMDGGSTWLFMYGSDDSEIQSIGGFCPMSETYRAYRRVIFENLPEELIEYYCNFFEGNV